MSAQLVFISLFLGLISGRQNVDLQVGPSIASVRILLDGRQVAEIRQAPWHVNIDFGPSIVPCDLVAVGYDRNGHEVARASQALNVPRPLAEFVIALKNDEKGVPASVELRWESLLGSRPGRSSLTVDGKSVSLDKTFRGRLPPLNTKHPHVIAAEMRFPDGIVRRELVIGGEVGYTAEAELTPVGVRQSASVPPADLSDCLTSAGSPVRISAIEDSPALVIFVLDPDPTEAIRIFDPMRSQGAIGLDSGTWMRILWPLPEPFRTTSNRPSLMFPTSNDVDARRKGLVWLLSQPYFDSPIHDWTPRQAADAAGAAGLSAITGAHRRAVVLVLSQFKDRSIHSGSHIRNYLASIGVPFFVWSPGGPRPDMQEQWEDIQDISSLPKLKVAAEKLRAELATQGVAWVAADAVTAFRVEPTGKCGIVPLARVSR